MYTTINAKYTKRSLKIVNHIKGRTLGTAFKVLGEETGNDRTQQLLHTQINWLLAGKMLK
jgi:hypothetical protein